MAWQRLAKLARLIQNFGDPYDAEANPELYRLTELRGDQEVHADMFAKATPDDFDRNKIPLIFIHGVEYDSHSEVVRDLVKPFLDHSLLARTGLLERYEICFVSWHSSLLNQFNHPRLHEMATSLPAGCGVLLAANHWSKFFTNAERRAEQVSKFLDPFVFRFLESGRPLPQIVTHSLGAYVWADFVQRQSKAGELPPRLGRWLNLQPAIPTHSFCPGGRFDYVAEAYNNRNACQEVWFSRLDMVLGSIYWVATRQRAMGLVGAKQRFGIPHVDMTWVSREAHGGLNLRPDRGCFLKRAGEMLNLRFQATA
jgi:hypothetical protein